MSQEQWQQLLSQAIDSQLEFDHDGMAGVILPDLGLYLGWIWQQDGLTLYAPLGQVSDPTLLQDMLSANAFWRQTQGATLSLYDRDQALLALALQPDQAPQIAHIYNQFLDSAQHWQQKLAA